MALTCYVAPWALPKESVPIHLLWNEEMNYDEIRVVIPQGVTIKEFYNVDSYVAAGEIISITRLKTQGFFGFVIALDELIEELHAVRTIQVSFLRLGQMLLMQEMSAHFYRPRLEIVESPDYITLGDKVDLKRVLSVKVRIRGFGRVNVATDINIGGGFETRGDALFRELVSRLLLAFKSLEEDEQERRQVAIDQRWLEKEAQKYAEKLKRGEVPGDFDEQDLHDFHDWISNPANADVALAVLSRQMENILIDSLLFYFDRYPADGVELRQGTPAMCIEKATENVLIRFRYRDALLNEYEPIQIAVKIQDQRTNKKEQTQIPINVSWIMASLNPQKEELCR